MTRETHDLHDADDEPLLPPPDKLYAHHRRQLSAMLDGELSPDEAKFMLRRLEHDTALAGCWERWQVCGDTLRGQRNALLPAGFAERVARAIRDDAAPVAVAATASRPRFARWGGGAAIAASVAVMALLVGRQLPTVPTLAPASSSVAAAPAAAGVAAPREAPDAARVAAASGVVADATDATVVPAPPVQARAARPASTRVASIAAARRTAPPGVAAEPRRRDPDGVSPVDALAAAGFAAPAASPRPWPRAVLPGLAAADGFSVGYGSVGSAAARADAGFAPFEPRTGRALAPLLSADSLVAPGGPARPVDADDADAGERASVTP